MNKIVFTILIGLVPILLDAQNPNGNYNPFVDDGLITPDPLSSHEDEGKGSLSFNIGNSGTDGLQVFSEQRMILTITLSYILPDHEDPLLAVSGSLAGYFSWDYSIETNTYSAVQVTDIPAGSSGIIEIAFQVARNSVSPGANGFNVNIAPAPYQAGSNDQMDDAVSSYTYTKESTSVGPIQTSGIKVFPNPSEGVFVVDIEKLSGMYLLEIMSSDGRIIVQNMVHLNAIPVSLSLDAFRPGLYHLRIYNETESYQEELILE